MTHLALSKKRYSFLELTILRERLQYFMEKLHYGENKPILIIKTPNFNIELKNACIPFSTCEKLYKIGQDSTFGKGDQTFLDKNIRSSKEFTNIQLDDNFFETVTNQIASMITKMGAGKLNKIYLHKLIIYGPDDFFSEHIDSCHTIGQNMSCVIELPSKWSNFGKKGLRIDTTDIYFDDSSKNAHIIIFDHDIPHEIYPITKGFRLSLTFDSVVDQTENKHFDPVNIVDTIKSLGVKKFGFFAMHRYLDGKNESQKLKGLDSILSNGFKPYVKTINRINLACGNMSDWYLDVVYDAMNQGPECGTMMLECDNKYNICEEDFSTPTVYEKPDNKYFRESDEIWHNVFKDEYKLGNIFVLYTKPKPTIKTITPEEDIYLGNESFDGKIIENAFIVFEF